MADYSDEELVERYRNESGPQKDRFLNQLFERHHARVAAWCYRMSGETDEATDLAQEVFLKAFQHLDSFRGQSKFTTWLYAIARNRCLDAVKSRAGTPMLAEEGMLDSMVDVRAVDCLADLERRQAQDVIRTLIRESLDETEVKVVTMHYADELPLEAVTRLLGLANASGAKAYIVSARRKLTRAFDRWNDREQRRRDGGHAESGT